MCLSKSMRTKFPSIRSIPNTHTHTKIISWAFSRALRDEKTDDEEKKELLTSPLLTVKKKLKLSKQKFVFSHRWHIWRDSILLWLSVFITQKWLEVFQGDVVIFAIAAATVGFFFFLRLRENETKWTNSQIDTCCN